MPGTEPLYYAEKVKEMRIELCSLIREAFLNSTTSVQNELRYLNNQMIHVQNEIAKLDKVTA